MNWCLQCKCEMLEIKQTKTIYQQTYQIFLFLEAGLGLIGLINMDFTIRPKSYPVDRAVAQEDISSN